MDQIKTFDIKNLEGSVKGASRGIKGLKLFHIPENDTIQFPNIDDWSSDKIYYEIARGHIPDQPFLNKNDKVMALGSCFANNLTKYLQKYGGTTTTYNLPANLQNVFSIQQFFHWINTGWENGAYWNEPQGGLFEPENKHTLYKNDMKECKAFIITLGLSEIWKDKKTDQIFWRAVPKVIFDENRHKFEIATVPETLDSLNSIVKIIREIQPTSKIIFTLSPVPLAATFTGKSCVTSNCVSKSILRVALDEFIRNNNEEIYYWPSYEMITEIPQHRNEVAYNEYDQRHVDEKKVQKVIETFMNYYYY